MQHNADPIVAIATAPGRGAVGIVRVSGPDLMGLAQQICGQTLLPRQAHYLPFQDETGQAIDQGLALFFPAPHSFTGEDVLELQAHGGPVVLQLILARCISAAKQSQQKHLQYIRLAQPGEFTQRAFLNGKLDLAQAEAVADLIDASTEAAARSATRSLSGVFSKEVHLLKEGLIHLRIWVEASIDFPEEEIDFLAQTKLKDQLLALQQQLFTLTAKTKQGALLREGLTVVIAGQPNAGKSSLLNALAGAELAIVTPIAGTTRDKISQSIQIEGVTLHIVDTAGLRDSSDEVEQIGVQRAWDEIYKADLVLFLHDLSRWQSSNSTEQENYQQADLAIAKQLENAITTNVAVVHVWNKLDSIEASQAVQGQHDLILAQHWETLVSHAPEQSQPDAVRQHHLMLSAKTGQGLELLRQKLLQLAGWQNNGEGLFLARERHVQALAQVDLHLELAGIHLTELGQLDLAAEELRLCQNALGQITGELSADDLLGHIFTSFCIGK